ncbi:MAG: BolA family transcriptional regulator [Proteobacteria bacterium]|nr:BolA family transcriptional regulator [Pseudomonadota bacterium]
MSERSDHIERALRERLGAVHVSVEDESHLHAGHAGARGGGGHFRAVVVCSEFDGLSSVQRQRRVYGALAEEMGSAIHALSLRTLTPEQWSASRAGSDESG